MQVSSCRKLVFLSCVAVMGLFSIALAESKVRFTSMGPGGGGTAGCLAVDPNNPNIAYIGLDCGGLHVTMDAGETWKNANIGIDYDNCLHWSNHYGLLVLKSGRVLATTDSGKIYLSDNHGQSWERVFVDAPKLGFLLQDPHDQNTVYAVTGRNVWERGRPLLDKPDDGWTWRECTGSIYVSREAGKAGSWVKLNTDPNKVIAPAAHVFTMAVDYQDPKLMYAATDYGMYRSTDGGKSWESVQKNLKRAVGKAVITIPGKPNVVYTTLGNIPGDVKDMESCVYRSMDRGETWQPLSKGLPKNMNFTALTVDPINSDVLYVGSHDWGGGLYRSTDGGLNWTLVIDSNSLKQNPKLGTGRNSTWANEAYHAVVGGVIWVGGGDKNNDKLSDGIYFIGDNNGVAWKSTDGGKDWQQISSREKKIEGRTFWTGRGEMELMCVRKILVDPTNAKHIWVCDFDWGQFESIDGGESWALVGGPWYEGELLGMLRSMIFDPDNTNILYCGVGGGVIQGASGGGFHVIGGRGSQKGGLPNGHVKDVAIGKWKENGEEQKYLYAPSDGNGVYRLNIGKNATQWEKVSDGVAEKEYNVLVNIPGTPKFLLGVESGIYITDDGRTWRRLTGENTAVPDVRYVYGLGVDPRNTDRIYASVMKEFRPYDKGGLYFSDDCGKTWARAADVPISHGIALDTVSENPTVYVTSQTHGVYKVVQDAKTKKWTAELFGDKSNGLAHTRCWTVTVDPTNHERIYVGTQGGFIFKGEPISDK